MTILFDGVIFAKKSIEGWVPHKRKDGQAAEKRQLSSGKWAYRLVEAEEPATPAQPTGLEAVLQSGDLGDPLDRQVLADALLDRADQEHNPIQRTILQKESDFLRGSRGNGAVYYGGHFREPYQLPPQELSSAVGAELIRNGASKNFPHPQTEHSATPIGTVFILLEKSARGSTRALMSGSTAIAAARQMRQDGESLTDRTRLGEVARDIQRSRAHYAFLRDTSPGNHNAVMDSAGESAWVDAHHGGLGELARQETFVSKQNGRDVTLSLYRMPTYRHTLDPQPHLIGYRYYWTVADAGQSGLMAPIFRLPGYSLANEMEVGSLERASREIARYKQDGNIAGVGRADGSLMGGADHEHP